MRLFCIKEIVRPTPFKLSSLVLLHEINTFFTVQLKTVTRRRLNLQIPLDFSFIFLYSSDKLSDIFELVFHPADEHGQRKYDFMHARWR